jgi:hypothetical protein
MKSDEERIAFVLHFMQTDLAGLREGDWLNLREDMVTFLGWSPRWRETLTPENVTLFKDEAARVLQEIARTFAPQKPGDWEARQPRILRIGDVATEAIFKLVDRGKRGVALKVDQVDFLFFDLSEAGRTRLHVGAPLRDAFLFSLLSTLSRLDISYLRQCPACSRLFYAEHGRQMFCTPQCASREGTRRFRAKNQVKENKRGRANYG